MLIDVLNNLTGGMDVYRWYFETALLAVVPILIVRLRLSWRRWQGVACSRSSRLCSCPKLS